MINMKLKDLTKDDWSLTRDELQKTLDTLIASKDIDVAFLLHKDILESGIARCQEMVAALERVDEVSSVD